MQVIIVIAMSLWYTPTIYLFKVTMCYNYHSSKHNVKEQKLLRNPPFTLQLNLFCNTRNSQYFSKNKKIRD